MNHWKLLSGLGTLAIMTAVIAAGVATRRSGPASAGPVPPGMALGAPAAVPVGQTFQITVAANPAPSVSLAGYQTEIILPPGLKWQPRPVCTDEVVATHSGGSSMAICLAVPGPYADVRHVAGSIKIPPLPPLDAPLTTLLEIDVLCNTAGSHRVALIDVGNSNFGAAYFDMNNVPIGVSTIPQEVDVDGDTQVDHTEVADALAIECALGPTATNTPTPEPLPVGGNADLPDVEGAALEAEGSTGPSAGLVAGIAAGIAASALGGLGGGAWYARRRGG